MSIQRYPASVITDWGGQLMHPKIRNEIKVGNIVRIPVDSNTMYFRITAQCKKKDWFVGVCEDPYYGDPDFNIMPCKNGDIRRFSKYHVMELPLEWSGNKGLKNKVQYRMKSRVMTGSY